MAKRIFDRQQEEQIIMPGCEAIIEQAEREEYQAFTEKFKPKKTTDDCMTPEQVYQAVADWVAEEWGLNESRFLRPFWPGADYQRAEYPEGCVVVDNPPFSIISQIIRWYNSRGIRFFLFGPSLTLFSGSCGKDISYVISDTDILYENGAVVRTSFVTNLESEWIIRSAPELHRRVEKAVNEYAKSLKGPELPKYSYPEHIVTAAMVQRYAKYGIDFRVRRGDAQFIREMDAQKREGKSIFGGGFLLSERAAAERAAAERARAVVWELSEREKRLVAELGKEESI